MSKPNILFIMVDDHAAKAISCYGGGLNNTPHLDSIATNGMRFDHCYVTNSICTPSRATILTGTHNHVNCVHTLGSKINNNLPNVAKHLRAWGGYQTAMLGKWHLGEGKGCDPEGSFDHWDVIPGQGKYFDPQFITTNGKKTEKGYVTDLITDKSLDFIEKRDTSRPFFVMCHHKAPHRMWECHPKHRHLYSDPIKVPDTYTDDYKNRAKAASVAKMRVDSDLTYDDLGFAQPEGAEEVGEAVGDGRRKIPTNHEGLRLIDRQTGEVFTFDSREQLSRFKYQRYLQRYLRTIQSIDDNVGRTLEYLKKNDLLKDTYVIYTSDQGFFLGEHGWFDKRFIYEESFQMPFMIQGPGIKPNSISKAIVSNVDFAPTWLDLVGLETPNYMQGQSFRGSLMGGPDREDAVAYHRYWMHADSMHNAYAHYGIRNHRYKLIFWYNLGYGLPGTSAGGQEQEWELFDCQEDPMELFNLWSETTNDLTAVKQAMVKRLEKEMERIGDIPAHPTGLQIEALIQRYPATNAAEKAKQSQTNM